MTSRRSSSQSGRPLPWGNRERGGPWPPWVPPPACTSPSRRRASPPPHLKRSASARSSSRSGVEGMRRRSSSRGEGVRNARNVHTTNTTPSRYDRRSSSIGAHPTPRSASPFLSRIDSVLKEHTPTETDPLPSSRRISPPRRRAPTTPLDSLASTPHIRESALLQEINDLDSALVLSGRRRDSRLASLLEEGGKKGGMSRDVSVSVSNVSGSVSGSDRSGEFLEGVVKRREAALSSVKNVSSTVPTGHNHNPRSGSRPRTVPHPRRNPPPRPSPPSRSISNRSQSLGPSPSMSGSPSPSPSASPSPASEKFKRERRTPRGRLSSANRRIDFDLESEVSGVSTQQGSRYSAATLGLRTVLESLSERVKARAAPMVPPPMVTPACDALMAEMVTYLDENRLLDPILQVCVAHNTEPAVHAAAERYAQLECSVGTSLLRLLGHTGEHNMVSPELCAARRERVTELATLILK